jgi:lipopolysaccharide/colanic/teichoic acid biosynthesis glycosyltransferase
VLLSKSQANYHPAPSLPQRHLNMAALSGWNHSKGKRILDLFLASVSLVLALPLIVLVALLLRVTSPGPVFFRQIRSGKGGRSFQLIKFRTMRWEPNDAGPKVTRTGDSRITGIGRILRKWKFDELPQLWNVLRGDMSFVGPRPDVPEYLATLSEAQAAILNLRPGLTGKATLQYRHEERLLSSVRGEDLNRFYCSRILPQKVQLDLDYAGKAGFTSDVVILLRTFYAIFN